VGYNEKTATGQLRYLQAVVERATHRVQLSFVLNIPSLTSSEAQEWESRAHSLFSASPHLWHSFWINLQPLPTNTIFGPVWKHVVGSPLIWETLVGCDIPLLPSHFAQANLDMFERLLIDLVALLPSNAKVVELFAGMGVISLVIRRHCASVTAVERDVGAYEAFVQAKQRLPECQQQGLHFVVGDAAACHDSIMEASTVIVDPPRKGLSKSLVEHLAHALNIRTVFYISCHFPTLERDIREMMALGGFHIAFARSYLFFPGTDQIETLVKFVRI
jgi:tRNA/tmRNA/rRNA uracil-C5-methylase (TrmA/RlmC/RlmD family)